MYDATIEQHAAQADAIDPTTLPRDQRIAYWSGHIQVWQRSGLSQIAYCRRENLVAHQFTYWLSKSQSTAASVKSKASTSRFVPVTVVAPTSSQLQITLPNGIVLTGVSDQNLALVQQFIQSL